VLVENGDNIITPVEKEQPAQKMRVYPNPATENFRIDFPTAGFDRMELFDTTGKTAFKASIDPSQTSAEFHPHLPAGLYFIKVSGSKMILLDKIMTQ
jgi:hypothetical protein